MTTTPIESDTRARATATLVAGVDFVPERVDADDPGDARSLLARDGAVIVCGWPPEPDSAVRAAAAILGTRLRWLEQLSERTTESAPQLSLHSDGASVVVNVHGARVQVRDHDIDYVLVQCVAPAPAGGESFVVDGYRLVERIREGMPELYAFLSREDVDFDSSDERNDTTAVPPTVCRIVEWTRGGRMVMRATDWAQPRPRTARREEHQRQLDRYADLLAAITERATTTRLARGDILVLDNYRCPHGVRAHEGPRSTNVLRCKSVDAW